MIKLENCRNSVIDETVRVDTMVQPKFLVTMTFESTKIQMQNSVKTADTQYICNSDLVWYY